MGGGEISVEAEDRILIAVGKVETKVDTLTGKFTASELKTRVAIAEIKKGEADCPIKEVESVVYSTAKIASDAKATADATKLWFRKISAGIAGVIATIVAALVVAVILGNNN